MASLDSPATLFVVSTLPPADGSVKFSQDSFRKLLEHARQIDDDGGPGTPSRLALSDAAGAKALPECNLAALLGRVGGLTGFQASQIKSALKDTQEGGGNSWDKLPPVERKSILGAVIAIINALLCVDSAELERIWPDAGAFVDGDLPASPPDGDRFQDYLRAAAGDDSGDQENAADLAAQVEAAKTASLKAELEMLQLRNARLAKQKKAFLAGDDSSSTGGVDLGGLESEIDVSPAHRRAVDGRPSAGMSLASARLSMGKQAQQAFASAGAIRSTGWASIGLAKTVVTGLPTPLLKKVVEGDVAFPFLPTAASHPSGALAIALGISSSRSASRHPTESQWDDMFDKFEVSMAATYFGCDSNLLHYRRYIKRIGARFGWPVAMGYDLAYRSEVTRVLQHTGFLADFQPDPELLAALSHGLPSRLCANCGAGTHLTDNCPLLNEVPPGFPPAAAAIPAPGPAVMARLGERVVAGGAGDACSHCGKKGHSVAGCWSLYPDQRPAFKNGKKARSD